LNSIDIIILIIVLIPALLGLRKGLIKSLVSLFAIMLGIYLATKFHSGFALVLKKFITDDKWLNVISFLIISISVYSIGVFIASKISKMNFVTKTIDKAGGIALGLFKGLLMASLLLLLSDSVGMISDKDRNTSLTYKYVSSFAPSIYDFVKKNIIATDKSFIESNDFLKKDTSSHKKR